MTELATELRTSTLGEGRATPPLPLGFSDMGNQVPDLAPYLQPGDVVVEVHEPYIARPTEPLSAAVAIMRLTGVTCLEDIGKNGPAVAAGVIAGNEDNPELNRYKVLFGRDSLWVSFFLHKYYPQLSRITLTELAAKQGIEHRPYAEEEPGAILHEDRAPGDPYAEELARERGWGWPYYATIDALPMFISGVANVARDDPLFLNEPLTGRDGQPRTMLYALQAAERLLLEKLDNNPEGLLEFKPGFATSLQNQVWMDSDDSYFHADGTMANHEQGIAASEVQVLAFDALHDLADLYRTMLPTLNGEARQQLEDRIKGLESRAEKLWQVFMDEFWIEDERGGYIAHGTDRAENGAIRPMAIRKSNMGHALASPRMLRGTDPEIVRRRNMVIDTLLSPDMLSVNGIRTLSRLERRYTPTAYHNGAVWPWQNELISRAIESYGDPRYQMIDERVWGAVAETRGLPELMSGEAGRPIISSRIVRVWDASRGVVNTVEQPPQDPQAWTAAARHAHELRAGS